MALPIVLKTEVYPADRQRLQDKLNIEILRMFEQKKQYRPFREQKD
jgi:hypothetical protein